MLTILAGVATWEREIMLERQREGIAEAKGEGVQGSPGVDRCLRGEARCQSGWHGGCGQATRDRPQYGLPAA
jgi:hypothetical protein